MDIPRGTSHIAYKLSLLRIHFAKAEELASNSLPIAVIKIPARISHFLALAAVRELLDHSDRASLFEGTI